MCVCVCDNRKGRGNKCNIFVGLLLVEYAQRVSEQVQMETIKAVVDDIICETESLLRDGLSVVVEEEMKVIYSNLW